MQRIVKCWKEKNYIVSLFSDIEESDDENRLHNNVQGFNSGIYVLKSSVARVFSKPQENIVITAEICRHS